MEWLAKLDFLKPKYFKIQEHPSVGFYLFVFENDERISYHLHDSFEIAIESAFEDYCVPKNAWEKLKSMEQDLMVLENIVDKLKNKLSQEDIDTVNELIDHNEWGIAYEHICVQLSEFDIPINRQLYEEIEKFGKLIETSDSYWLHLQELIVEDESNKSTEDNGFKKNPE